MRLMFAYSCVGSLSRAARRIRREDRRRTLDAVKKELGLFDQYLARLQESGRLASEKISAYKRQIDGLKSSVSRLEQGD
ncbi:MAG: hypothetical protein ACLFO2_05320 [Candidatus Woesearchaeota archaeon]